MPEIDTICNEHLPLPDDEVITTIREMHLKTQALRAQRFGESKVSILIWADHYWELVTGNVRAVTPTLKAVETLLGWTVSGPLPIGENSTNCANAIVLRACVEANEGSKALNSCSDFGNVVKCNDEQISDTELFTTHLEKALEPTNKRQEVSAWKPSLDQGDSFAVSTNE